MEAFAEKARKSASEAKPASAILAQLDQRPRGLLRVNYRLEKEGPFDPGEMILSGSIP